jgi:VIT1/CCC1 family predicted Fe2+/Mn2+ transporter
MAIVNQPKHHHHKEEHLASSQTIQDIVIGMADGLTVPFALAAGLSGAVDSNAIILTAGIAEVAAGCIAMGLGGYLAGKTEMEHYESEVRREYDEIERFPEVEKEEVREVFRGFGLDAAQQEAIVETLSKNKDKWVEFMMRFELGLEKPDVNRARNSGFTIGLSYIVGGIIPLLGYMFTKTPSEGLPISAAITLVVLFIFGFFKSKITGQPALIGAIRTTAIGAVAAATAYTIAKMLG